MRVYAQKPKASQQPASALPAHPRKLSESICGEDSILQLQRAIGNQATLQRLLPEAGVSVAEFALDAGTSGKHETAPPVLHEALHSPGQRIEPKVRTPFQGRFRCSFSDVRVHADSAAARSARDLGARAYTVGKDVVFGAGQYAPETNEGRHLLAHELTHVVQQCGARTQGVDDASLAAKLARRTRIASPLVQRIIPQGLVNAAALIGTYAQAVHRLRLIDPALHRYLALVVPGGGRRTIKSQRVQSADTPPTTIQYTFSLEVLARALPGRLTARFQGGTPSLTGSGNARAVTANMTLEVAAGSGPSAVSSMAQGLYHEGIHMLLFMESLLPSHPLSPHASALANYQSIARQHSGYARLVAELRTFVASDLTRRQISRESGYAARVAREIVDRLIEEKYVHDQERRQFGTQFTHRSLAATYIQQDLQTEGIRADLSNRAFQSIIDKATSMLGEIHRHTLSQPLTTQPSSTTPWVRPPHIPP